MSETNFPPAGTRCSDCGCCEASVYAGNAPICWECDAGTLCPGRKRANRAIERDLDQGEVLPAPTREQVLSYAREKLAPKEKPVSKQGMRISEEVKAKILAEPSSMSASALAAKYGVSDVTVLNYRKQAGIVSTAKRGPYGPRRVPETPRESKPAPRPAAITQAVPVVSSHNGVPVVVGRIAVTVQMDEASADAFWARLTKDQKVAAIQLQLTALLANGATA